jgi:MFS family permease
VKRRRQSLAAVLELGALARFGRNYRKLLASHAISNLGDGVRLSALPLLAATLTRDPVAIASLTFASFTPAIVFGLFAGVLADRLDRRLTMVVTNVVRAGMMAGLGVLVLADWISMPVLYAVAFLLGTAETFFENAAQAIIPAVAPRDELERANGFLYSAEVLTNQFAGPALGGVLFAAAAAAPFLFDASSFALAAVLIIWIHGHFRPRREETTARAKIRTEIGEALRWLLRHRLLRSFAVMLGVINLLNMAWFAIFVLYSLEVIGLSEAGYGAFLAAGAVGSFAGSVLAPRLSRRLGTGRTLLLVVATLGVASLGMGLATEPVTAAVMWIVASFAEMVWVVITVSLRQAIVPDRLLGRITSVYRLVGWGTVPAGTLLGGFLAGWLGLRSPFLLSAAVFGAMALLAAPVLNERAIRAAGAAAGGIPRS